MSRFLYILVGQPIRMVYVIGVGLVRAAEIIGTMVISSVIFAVTWPFAVIYAAVVAIDGRGE